MTEKITDKVKNNPKTEAVWSNVPFSGLVESIVGAYTPKFSDWLHGVHNVTHDEKFTNFSDYKRRIKDLGGL
jgi:hypothetical protein